jgi:hypothetical protein
MTLSQFKNWFDQYDIWVHEVERAERLGIAWEQEDKILKVTYHSLNELDLKAEEMRKRYKEEKENIKQRAIEWRKSKGLGV